MKRKTAIIIIFAFLIIISASYFIIPKPANQQGYETEILVHDLNPGQSIFFQMVE